MFQLAGILLDTQNLKTYDKSSMTRDSEAVQLLLVGSAPSYRYSLYDQCMLLWFFRIVIKKVLSQLFYHNLKHLILYTLPVKEEQIDKSFLESLRHNYGKPPNESKLPILYWDDYVNHGH